MNIVGDDKSFNDQMKEIHSKFTVTRKQPPPMKEETKSTVIGTIGYDPVNKDLKITVTEPEEKEQLSAEEVLDKHIVKLITTHKDYNSLENLKKLPEYKVTIAAMEEYRSLPAPVQQSDAVEFGDWATANFDRTYPRGIEVPVYYPRGYQEKFEKKMYTTTELYKLFKDGK